MVEVLKRCGDDLSRDNIMKQAASLKGVQVPMLIPGIVINTSASDHAPLEQMQMMQFNGGNWNRFGPVRSGVDPGAVSNSFKTIFRYGTAKRDLADQLNANTVTLMTGAFGTTYAQMGADLASVLDKGVDLRVLPVMGRGSVQAVADILLLRGVDAGIVRKDTLAYLERKDFANNIRSQFVYITKMFNEEMHVLAPKTIQSMKDLDGKTVAVDLPDSSHLRDLDQRVRAPRRQAASALYRAADRARDAAQGRHRRDRRGGRQAVAMAQSGQRSESASGAGRLRQVAARATICRRSSRRRTIPT